VRVRQAGKTSSSIILPRSESMEARVISQTNILTEEIAHSPGFNRHNQVLSKRAMISGRNFIKDLKTKDKIIGRLLHLLFYKSAGYVENLTMFLPEFFAL
jgi:hypothetical protein